MLVFDQVLMTEKDVVFAHKEKIGDHSYLNSYCNTHKATLELYWFGRNAQKNNGVIEPVDCAKKRDLSSIIVFDPIWICPVEASTDAIRNAGGSRQRSVTAKTIWSTIPQTSKPMPL